MDKNTALDFISNLRKTHRYIYKMGMALELTESIPAEENIEKLFELFLELFGIKADSYLRHETAVALDLLILSGKDETDEEIYEDLMRIKERTFEF